MILRASRETSAHSGRPRSGGLVEAEFQGLSDMDVARAAMGQGWPFVGGRLVRAPETSLQ
ncbi:hypothetical protein F1C79_00805 [Pseudomonas denitrificans (nom. rej.)]|uniref:Uncharacterized protein n=1 Tax=Pseudomonas denitrificans TaxID=43306 RepID=A0A9X7R339_PSEDE|nr:hypothetical protein F1C79_00805 [Pseudomonas denitrificans (nom. rej.)]